VLVQIQRSLDMSQLDISISFNQFIGLTFCFTIFLFYINQIINKYYYNEVIREELKENSIKVKQSLNSNLIIKKICTL